MITILVVEDNSLQLQNLNSLLTEYNPQWNILQASTYKDAITYIETNTIQLFLLDVELNNENSCENGIELAKIIRANDKYRHTPIIFITAIFEKIYEALNETHCYQYLLKPYDKKSFFSALDTVITSPLMEEQSILIKDPTGVYIQLNQKDILYISMQQKQLLIHTIKKTFPVSGITMDQISEELYSVFIRCHKKYIINLKEVQSYDKTNRLIHIKNIVIPVGRFYKKTFEQALVKSVLGD